MPPLGNTIISYNFELLFYLTIGIAWDNIKNLAKFRSRFSQNFKTEQTA
jgi:hypothetical protein